MSATPRSLRSTVAVALFAIAALALIAAGALVVSTTVLRRSTAMASAAAESVRLAEEAQIELLLHARAIDEIVKSDIESATRERVRDLEHHVSTAAERASLAEAQTAVNAYFAASTGELTGSDAVRTAHGAAFTALEKLVSVNLAQAQAARSEAARWDALANLFGAAVPILVVVVGGAVLRWLRRNTVSPTVALASVMERFAKGERDVHAEERGPAELQLMSRRFNQMAAALADRRKAQMAFLGGVAHDLRNPLSALKVAAQLGRGKRLDEERRQQLFERVLRQTERLERMLGDLIDSARIEAGELELRTQQCDLRAIVTEVAAMFEDTSTKHRLTVSLPAAPVELSCDPLRIEQVLTNLMSNAFKYSPDGGLVEVEVRRDREHVVVVVKDEGLGISEQQRGQLFEPFRRGDEAAARDIPGVGLGLHVVWRIVQAHGGRIDVASQPGAGSTFTVMLPAEELAAPPPGPRPHAYDGFSTSHAAKAT